ncbi:ABC transporter substrate-binding protein [Halocalculus aciditolerans]|uniref:Amino acid ABC transporter substrate-binding protein n=1 Tax=Halocalculus aciditolerans TaxID=1383812 RepID=A0A830FKW6_9EURY|nr:ABC transporter substrate-binding protein [Halocalculus aciditolerans]GGL65994.1 amino acid ABC transporter substrate-binding protein [Halocalculus aciditolerans]
MDSTRRSLLKRSGIAAAAISTTGLAGCSSFGGGGGGTIKLGAINPLSGSAAFYGELATKAQTAWKEQVNENGGIEVDGSTRQVELVEYDDESKNSAARSAAKRLATVDDVSMILSSWRSTGAIAVAPIANQNEVPTFTHGFTPQVNDPGTYMMRLTVSTVMDAYPALQQVEKSDEIQNIGVIAETGDWGDDTLALMDWWFNESGHEGDYKNLGRFSFSQQDFSSYLTKAKQAYNNGEIDALYVQTWASAMQRFLAQQHREGLHEMMPILTGLGGADFNSVDDVGEAMENVYALGVYTRLSYADNDAIAETISDEALTQFDQYKQLDAPMHPVAFNVYADAQISQRGIEEAGSTEGAEIRNALVGTEFTTLIGDATINDRGQPAIPGALIKFGTDGDTPVVDEVPWSGQLPPITSIPPETDL